MHSDAYEVPSFCLTNMHAPHRHKICNITASFIHAVPSGRKVWTSKRKIFPSLRGRRQIYYERKAKRLAWRGRSYFTPKTEKSQVGCVISPLWPVNKVALHNREHAGVWLLLRGTASGSNSFCVAWVICDASCCPVPAQGATSAYTRKCSLS